MEDFSRVADWLKTIKIKQLFHYYKLLLCLSSIIYGIFFGITTGILIFLLSVLFCKLPILIVRFNDLRVEKTQSQLMNTIQSTPSSRKVPHDPYFLIKNNNITVAVNDTLEKFLNELLDKFIISWQGSFKTSEEHFVIELRHALKYIIIRLYNLIQKVDISKLLIEKVVPLSLWHLDCFSTGCSDNTNKTLEKNVLSCFGKNLHCAVESRKAEELYLRHYSARLLHYLLPPQLQQSKLLTILLRDILSCQIFQNAMDVLADPDSINQLIIIMLDQEVAILSDQETLPVTPILHNFATFTPTKPEPLIYPPFSSILKTPPHLYHLMQFLKRENSLKYLQFCFAVDDFNEKLLNPDLKREQLERLQLTARKLFEIFFFRHSPDRIQFGTESESQMKKIVYGNIEDIVLLRTCPTLFEAYDHVMDTLENKILIRFYRSEEFYQLVRDMQHAGGFSKNARYLKNPLASEKMFKNLKASKSISKNSQKKTDSSTSGWSKKIRSALRPAGWLSAEVGRLPGSNSSEFEEITYDTGVDLTEADFIPEESDEQDSPSSYRELIPICGRDLTAWRAVIPRVVSAIDSSGKSIWAFEVDVQRIDLRPEDDPDEYHWTVIRTYPEFYNLEAKLAEFHGEFLCDIRLPAKKMFGTRSFEFLESLRLEFEWYLKTLLQQSALKGSDLIFSFLTLSQLSAAYQTAADGSLMPSNILPDLGLGRMIRHVPLKLRKERGQHLDHFLQSFVASTEAPKSRPSKVEGRDSGTNEVSMPVVKDLHPIYKNNAITFLSGPLDTRHSVHPLKLEGPFECLLFIAWKIWKIPQTGWCTLVGLGSILKDFFDSYTQKYVDNLLGRALHPEKIALGIKLLHGAVLDEESNTDRSETENKKRAWECIIESLPHFVRKSYASTWVEDQCLMVFRCLQYPVFNKQLSYVLFEAALREICPEIFEEDDA